MIDNSAVHRWQVTDNGDKAVCQNCGRKEDLPYSGGLPLKGCQHLAPQDRPGVKYISDFDPNRPVENPRQAIKQALKLNTSKAGGFAGEQCYCVGIDKDENGDFVISSTSHNMSNSDCVFIFEILSHIYKQKFLGGS